MIKKFFSLLLTVCMVLAMMPAMSVRAEETHMHCVCGATSCSGSGHNNLQTWQAWNETASLPSSKGYYYLTGDVTIASTWSPVDDTVLCLNGHTITGKGTSIISVGRGTFTLTNCKNEGSVKHAEGESGKGVENAGTFNMYGGEITNNKADSSGGGVENSGTFNMYGGEITNNKADSSDSSGGGVENSGTFNMYGGEITNNKADSSDSSGGGVENFGIFNMYGGEITNNKADASGPSGGGGGVENAGTFNMYGGEISSNTAEEGSGGGVRNIATFNMYGGTIAKNTAKYFGGGVENAGTFNMYGGEISNNKAGYHGGGVNNEGTFNMQGGQITTNEAVQYGGGGVRNGYSATFTMQGGEITNNQATTIGGGVSYLGGSFKVSGNVKITGNKNQSNASSNLYLGSDQTITIESPLTVGASIGVTVKVSPTEGNPVVITSAGSSDHSSFFFSDSSNYQVYNDNNTVKLRVQSGSPAGHTHCICGATHSSVGDHTTQDDKTFIPWESPSSLPTSGYYYLTQDVTVEWQWRPADGTVLCLNGHKITSTTDTGFLYLGSENENNITFTLTDCSESASGGIFRNKWNATVFNYGTFNIYGGIIQNKSGTGIENKTNGTFNMYGGSLAQNSTGVNNYGTIIMRGGNITQNGTGVSNKDTGKITMRGGNITDNSTGVSNDGKITVSGSANINNNNGRNVVLNNPGVNKIKIDDVLNGTIGVTATVNENSTLVIANVSSSAIASIGSNVKSDQGYDVCINNENNTVSLKRNCAHLGVKQSGKPATCREDGYKEYYKCSKCNELFEEQACSNSIENLDTWKTGTGRIPTLGHDWKYSANGATLTASCNRKDSCGMEDQTLTLTINNSLSYTGSGLTPASFESPTSGWTTNVSSPLPTIKYYKTNTKDATTGGIAVSGNPKDVGYYYASATVGTDGNSATAVKAFEIQKADPTISNSPVAASLTYNETAQELLSTAPATSGGTVKYAVTTVAGVPEDDAFATGTPKATNAGTYYVYYKVVGDENHNDKIFDPITVTIAKKSQSVSAPTASETKATKVTLNEVVGHGTTTYAKNTTNGAPTDPSAWQTSNVFTALTKNTTYYFFAKCAGDNNYNAGTSTGAEIATPDLTSRTISGVTAKDGVNTTGISYGTAITPGMLFTGTPVLENAENPVTAYKYKGVSSTVYPEIIAAPTAVGTYKLVIVMNDDNYYGTQEIPFTIVKSSPAAVNATGVAPTGSNVSDGKIQVTGVDTSLYTLEYKGTGATTSPAEWTAIDGLEVTGLAAGGTYLVRIKGTGNNNESPATEVTIPAYVAPPAGGGGSGISGGGASTPSTDKDNDTKTEPTTLPDGTKVETSTTTDETTGATTVEEKKTALDGTVTETKTTTQKDGSSETTSTETRTDGSTTETNTTVDTEGTAKSVVRDKDFPTGDVLTIRKIEEPNGEVSYVLATLVTEEATIVKAKVERAEALANMKNIPYRVKVLDENGKLAYKVRVNTGDVKANQTLYVYKYDSKTKSFGLVQADYQKVKADEKANIICDFENLISTQRYQLVTKSKAGLLDKKILATVKAKIGQKSLKVNQSTSFKLDEKLNLENVSTIKYSTSDKQVVKVSKAGKITGKNTGTADIKATITLINGKTKTVRMKIKVK